MQTTIDYGDGEDGSPLHPVFASGPAGPSHVACFDMGGEFFLYRGDTLVRVCPSIGMAREVAGGL